ncbi:calcitonin gene-related peptide type 1 receptor-like isoform X2 [Neocloeon triangulifer]|uniref:calcitonin gene-related peptide type 1 receptor-like isoform X2 n=1 Tax=Neocloeon triangulifer TaxID=2078957 RepID=UPI00286F2FE3|nr:calcitonin gene-related peptide type 1 receptor-like isoform X2 [Neocloeon triangulifer]
MPLKCILVAALIVQQSFCESSSNNGSATTQNVRRVCRARDAILPPHLFALHTCALCYTYMMPAAFREPARPQFHPGQNNVLKLLPPRHNESVFADASDDANPLLQTFSGELAKKKWLECCNNARICCDTILANVSTTPAGWCPRTWDGWMCWGDSTPSTMQYNSCPTFIALTSEPPSCMQASKMCLSDGTWFRSQETGAEWTNYSTCSTVQGHQNRAYISLAAFGVSVVALVPALVIFSIYRQLRVPRVALHRHLFTSLLLNAIAVIVFKGSFLIPATTQGSLITKDGLFCKTLIMVTKYFRVSNYMWMFCEGFYLHRLIAAAFVEETSLLIFYLIGWGLPVVVVASYFGAIIFHVPSLDVSECWSFPDYDWVLYAPCLLSLAINFLFLIDIIRVLWLKLRARHAQEPSQYRKAVRATLVLVPLFGLHLCLTMYRPPSGSCSGLFIQIYNVADYLLDGLQGCFVSLSFCYFSGEVQYLVKRSYQRFVQRHRPNLTAASWLSADANQQNQMNSQTTMSLAEPVASNRRGTRYSCPTVERTAKNDTLF